MPDTVHAGKANLDLPRSPVSISTEAGTNGSVKPIHPEKNSEPPTPNSPPARLGRKRAASLNTESANQQRMRDLALDSADAAGSPSSEPTREQVCLCQPDPKIPRPRNAFILYRQHYQAQVVAQHPGLANPEISKIIGEQWREQSLEVKGDWKRLAEEEKQRHQRQYPGYRYQPRRAGKPNGTRPLSTSSTDDPIRCPKCSGRYISTPSTPLTPFMSVSGTGQSPRGERLLPPFTPTSSSRVVEVERPQYTPQMQNSRTEVSRTSAPHQQMHRRPPYPQPHPLQTRGERDEDMDPLTPSPEQKRRRFNNEQQHVYHINSPISYSSPQHFARNGAPMSAGGYRTQQLPVPGMLVASGNMGPPAQQSPLIQQSWHQYRRRSNTFDESLRLPPLKPQVSNHKSTKWPELRVDNRDSQAKSVEAMVMTIPYVNKIKVLTKISPPLALPGPASPAHEIRGAIIAVEGEDMSLVAEIGEFINENLSRDSFCAVKTWFTSMRTPKQAITPASDTEMAEAETPSSSAPTVTENGEQEPFVEYLSKIAEWHRKSQEMTKYITTAPPPLSNPVTEIGSTNSSKSRILPIALLPKGFSLSTSDHFALRIPINDSYAPVDHWQWMATLWRGIVGPDLTIYVKKVEQRDEVERFGGVEMRNDFAGIVVRVQDGGKMDEKTARRLGFEVLEFVRGTEGGFGRA